MKTIWKFPLAMVSPQRIDMPEGAQILTVQAQGDFGCIWALVDPDVEKQSHYFEIYGTGQVVTDDGVTERTSLQITAGERYGLRRIVDCRY